MQCAYLPFLHLCTFRDLDPSRSILARYNPTAFVPLAHDIAETSAASPLFAGIYKPAPSPQASQPALLKFASAKGQLIAGNRALTTESSTAFQDLRHIGTWNLK